MLIKLKIKNYKSFKEESSLDLLAAPINELSDSLLRFENHEVLPIIPLFGLNATGKTNVLESLVSLKELIILGIRSKNYDDFKLNIKHPFEYFKLDENSKNKPITEEVTFYSDIKKRVYSYRIEIKNKRIEKEELTFIKNNKVFNIFKRDNYKFDFNKTYLDINEELINLIKKYNSKIPTLSILYNEINNDYISDVIDNFIKRINYISFGKDSSSIKDINDIDLSIFNFDSVNKRILINIFKTLDINIDDYLIKESGKSRDITTIKKIDNKDYKVNLKHESEGVKKLFYLIPRVLYSLKEGNILLVDELGNELHPLVLRAILSLYRIKSINKFNAQVIFTNHDVSILNSDILRRDEIYFVNKNNNQSSELISLYDFKGYNNKFIKKNTYYIEEYLHGLFGSFSNETLKNIKLEDGDE